MSTNGTCTGQMHPRSYADPTTVKQTVLLAFGTRTWCASCTSTRISAALTPSATSLAPRPWSAGQSIVMCRRAGPVLVVTESSAACAPAGAPASLLSAALATSVPDSQRIPGHSTCEFGGTGFTPSDLPLSSNSTTLQFEYAQIDIVLFWPGGGASQLLGIKCTIGAECGLVHHACHPKATSFLNPTKSWTPHDEETAGHCPLSLPFNEGSPR